MCAFKINYRQYSQQNIKTNGQTYYEDIFPFSEGLSLRWR